MTHGSGMIRARLALVVIALAFALASCSDQGDGAMMDEPWDGPVMPPVDPQAAAQFREWQEDNALPAIFLASAGPAPATPQGSRIGGKVWLPAGEDWPQSRAGVPMEFVAQIDFAQLPHIPDFPTSGLLQFFIAPDMMFGADFNQPENGDFKVFWREDVDGAGSLRDGGPDGRNGRDYYSPMEDTGAGIALTGAVEMHLPTITAWHLRRDLPELTKGKGRGTMNAAFDAHYGEAPERHHVGGHPEFTQDDWRIADEYQHVDRVLLNLWSKDGMMWGDAGQGQFLIGREDLLKRDFSKVYYAFDGA